MVIGAILSTSQASHPHRAPPLPSAPKQQFRHISTQPNWLSEMIVSSQTLWNELWYASRPEDRAWLIPDTHSFGCMFSSPLPAEQPSSTLPASDKSELPRHCAENASLPVSISYPHRYIHRFRYLLPAVRYWYFHTMQVDYKLVYLTENERAGILKFLSWRHSDQTRIKGFEEYKFCHELLILKT